MKTDYWLDQIPLWGVFLLAVVGVFLSIQAGTWLGIRRHRNPEHENEASMGTIIGAVLGLVAFMLAFTFGITVERFQASRQFLLHEVNAINTTRLRAQLLRQPHPEQVSSLLRQYVDLRVSLAGQNLKLSPEAIKETIARSEQLQHQMWSHAVALAAADRSSEIDALFIDSLNELIDLQTSRLTVLTYRIPQTVWECLFFITILAMLTAGYQAGLSGNSSVKIGMVLALTFAAVILLIVDLDRGWEGRLRVNNRPMFELQTRMQASP